MNSALLTVKDLHIEFGHGDQKVEAVKGVSFDLQKGECLGIVGESGSGKSVTSLSIMQLISYPGKVSKGEIQFKGEELIGQSNDQLNKIRGNKIAMIFQEPMTSLNPVIRCGKQITESLLEHSDLNKEEAKSRTIELFKEVKLPRPEQIFDSYPHQLSGGQKQRVMIAMALCCQPDILIADEPTTALDVTVQKSILELLKQLLEKYGMSIIFITHDLGVIAEIANRVMVMYQGEIVEKGDLHKVFKNAEHPYTQGLIACRPQMDRLLKRLPTISDFMNNEQDPENFIKSLQIDEKDKFQLASETVLKVENLSTYFPVKSGILGRTKSYVKAVENVNIEVREGETLGLVGESGCGKTTLGRSILKLIDPYKGKVLYKDQEISKLSNSALRKLRKELQIIFQDPYSSLNPRKTIGEAIKEPMQVHGIFNNSQDLKIEVDNLLVKVGLEAEMYDRYPHELSGGQRQRVCIARALGLKPKFIICDESVSALDVSVQAQILNLLNDLKKEYGLTYIFISHDLSVVKHMADRIAVMKDGEIVEYGLTEEVYSNPQSDYTRKLIDAVPKGI
ncbi:MAG: ABC transporter ATP-binding protein [Bacteroidetes bacterium]|nr:ABC transporter ATP-binding protein [Bacteroidota bacterium]